ncbi:hypothetical protein [Bacillus badius]|uniref:Uncharacterized protein n=1 Tax=Bacillus badius TaxID=1455 RepID=A0ABR5APD3_BACBA|nr:hypothetical protein [Bacillus badius]KIL73735.1 hypothetical protein SD77_3012 [Bacillus badius]MED4715249.1 hypothetical protein [Bacillus badius]
MMSEFEIKRAEKLKREALKNSANHDLIRVPVFERVYMKDGELYGEFPGNPIPRKLSDYAASVNNNEKD